MRNSLLSVYFLLLSVSPSFAGPPASWPFKPWDEAVSASKVQKKPLLVLFGYDDCKWCHVLYRGGMNDDEVLARYSANLVLTYVDTKTTAAETRFRLPDGSSVPLKELLKLYRAYPVPSWVYLAANGTVLHSNRLGTTTARELLKDMEVALSKWPAAPAAQSMQ